MRHVRIYDAMPRERRASRAFFFPSFLFLHQHPFNNRKEKKRTMSDNCWDAFGSDSDSDANEESEIQDDASIALFLSQFFLKQNPQVKLSERKVGLADSFNSTVRLCLEQRGLKVVVDNLGDSFLDALIIIQSEEAALASVLPGGLLVAPRDFFVDENIFLGPTPIDETHFVSRVKRSVLPHTSMCPWLPSSFSIEDEKKRLQEATIVLSTYEIENGFMTESSILRAVQSISQFGYVVIRNLLNPDECKKWGEAVLQTVHLASKILLERENVNILNPQQSSNEPQSYRELSMREDLRLDLRHGPQLSSLRCSVEKASGDQPVVLKATSEGDGGFLRGNKSILEIIRRAMNPKRGSLYKGNIGRYNFDGSGPDGSYQDLRVSQVGGIVSFPGAADQAIHADCAHLFEHMNLLPAHYINIFAPGVEFNQKVGGTAFFHGSHDLAFTERYCGSNNDNTKVYPFLVRPSLTLGDAVLFDCRILHFGLSNTSESIERVVLYSNTTQAWFHDPKNWDDKQAIFDS